MKRVVGIVFLIAVLYCFVWIWLRPWFHWLFFWIFWMHPILWLGLIVIGGAGAFWIYAAEESDIRIVITVLGVVVFLIVYGSLWYPLSHKIVTKTQEYHKITEIPDTNQARLLPFGVARRYANDSLQEPQRRLGHFQPLLIDGKFSWVTPRVPDGVWLYLTRKMGGLMILDGDTVERKSKLINQEMAVSEGVGVSDNFRWRVYKFRYLVDVPEILYVPFQNELLGIVPYIEWKFHFPVRIPTWGGVFVIHPDGKIEDYKPSEAQRLPYLAGNRIFPEKLARYYGKAYAYYRGIWNKWFIHKDQIEIADVEGEENRQPYLISTKEGLKWIIAAEPTGRAYGILKIFVIDAFTGRIELYELSEETTLTGAVKAADYIKKHFPRISWTEFTVIEPRPVVVQGVLYWMLSIVPKDFAGIGYTTFLDTRNNRVFAFETEVETKDFVLGKRVAKVVKEVEEEKEEKEELIRERIKNIEEELGKLKELLESK